MAYQPEYKWISKNKARVERFSAIVLSTMSYRIRTLSLRSDMPRLSLLYSTGIPMEMVRVARQRKCPSLMDRCDA